MAKPNPQISVIAKATNVSNSTVSIVLNGRGDELRISKATQERIRKTAMELGYIPNMAARNLRASKSAPFYIFALFINIDIIRKVDGNYFSGLIAELYLSLKRNGINAEIVVHPYFPGKLYEDKDCFSSNRYNGIIVNSATDKDVNFLLENDYSVPIVIINRETNGKYMNISINDYEGGKTCAQIFAANGHRKAVIAGIKEGSLAMRMRMMGFLDGCKQEGIEIADSDVIYYKDSIRPNGESFISDIISRDDFPTALLIYSGDLAYDALTACRLKGISIPDDLEIIVFGFDSSFQYCSPSLTSFSVSNHDIAENAIELLLLSMNNPSLFVSKPTYVTFHFRDSCKKPDFLSGTSSSDASD